MKKWLKISLKVVLIILVVVIALSITYILINSNKFADYFVYNLIEERYAEYENDPESGRGNLDEFGLTDVEEVILTTSDSLNLEALYFPSQNGATIILVHGFKSGRFNDHSLIPTSILVKNGYGVIYPMRRAHGHSDGEIVTFGKNEIFDLEAAYQFLINKPEVNVEKIGLLGQSMGAAISIIYASKNYEIKAIIAEDPYDSYDNTIGTSVEHYTGLPAFPFANIIKFFAERKLDLKLEDYDPVKYIAQISPRPVFILSGGEDATVNSSGGKNLFQAAGNPVEYWYESEYDHGGFRYEGVEKYEKRIIEFFDKYLLEEDTN